MTVALCAGAWTAGAEALDPGLDWYTLEGPHFKLTYHAGEERLAQHALDVAEQVATKLDPWLGWEPKDKVYVVLTDHEDLPNGLTTSFPRDHIELYATPPDGLDTLEDFDDWFRLLITHEYTHILQLDKATGAPAFMQHFFGRNFLLMPGIFQPTMLVEGLAVYDETDKQAASGRGQSSLYAMYMRAEVARGVRPWSQVTMAGVTQWPEGAIPYLYGVNFYQFIDQTYGRDKIPALVDNYSDHLIPFRVGGNLEDTLGDDRDEVWSKFTAYLDGKYAAPPYPTGTALLEGERLSHHGYDTSSSRAAADGRVFYVRDDSHQHPAIMVWQDGQSRELAPTFGPARLDWNAKAGLLVARPDVCHEYYFNFDLYRVDPDSGSTTRLTKCGRYHYAAWSPDGTRIAAARMDLGQSSLVLMDADGGNPKTLWSGQDGEILGGLDWSPDGSRLVAAVWRHGTRWGLEEFSLATNTWQPLVQGIGDVGDPEYSPDGKGVLFTADAGGVYNLRRVDLSSRAITTLTHVSTGAFSPTQGSAGGDIYYIGYTAEGYDLYRLPAGAALAEPLTAAAPTPTDYPPPPHVTAYTHPYSALDGFLPAYWTPELAAGPDVVLLGAATTGQDALGVNLYAADINYEFTHHLVGGSFLYQYADRLQFLAAKQYELYFDSSNKDLERIRRQDRLQGVLQKPWVSLERTLTLSLGAAGDAEKDVYDAPGFGAVPDKDSAAGLAFEWNSTQDWPISISPDDGRDVLLVGETSDAFHSDYHGDAYRLDWNEFIRAGDEAVVALGYQQGYGTVGIKPFNLGGTTDPGAGTPAAQFLFDRRQFAFPGYPSGVADLTGDRMRLASFGLRIPIMRPEAGFKLPPVGVHDFSLRAYFDIGGTWDQGGRPARYSRSTGVEWVSDLSLFYIADIRLVVGAAHGFDTGGENQAYAFLEVPIP